MKTIQHPVAFGCGHDWLLGVITRSSAPQTRGVLVVVGGPQYRAGSHRHFALLAHHLAAEGYAVMRFDYRGMGDSTGSQRSFEHVADDIRAALDTFFRMVPEMREVAIWGLCDAASAALLYAYQDERVAGVALLNPWIRTSQTEAQTWFRHYYAQHLLTAAPWKKLLKGELDVRGSLGSLARNFARAGKSSASETLPGRMAAALARFHGRVLLILSGNDLTAKEFIDAADRSPAWRKVLGSPRVTRYSLPGATHTFARREWRDQVARWTTGWLASW